MNVLDDVVGPHYAKALMPLVAYSAGKAQRGEKLSTLASGTAGLATLPMMAGWGTNAFRLVAPTLGGPAGAVAGFLAGALLSATPNEWLRSGVFRSMRLLTDRGRSLRRLEMGGDYRDTETAAAMRQAAVQEMTGTRQATRTWLGQEAAFLHR
jgi:hypothetical protein